MKLDAPESLGLAYVLKNDAKPSITSNFVRENELETALTDYVLKSLTPYEANKFLEYEDIVRSLLVHLLDSGAIGVKETALSGRYFKFELDKFQAFRSEYLEADPFYLEGKEVGERYFPDAFDAIERAVTTGAALQANLSTDRTEQQVSSRPNAEFFQAESRKAEFIAATNTSLEKVDDAKLSNSEKAQARGFLMAAKALAETPEPPVDLIWTILQRANSIAGIASFFVSLLALIAMVTI
tara:strand:+ start:147 stop:866 length:720 start_codon:yes stop_codon:yes gene_type:complete